MGLWNRFRSWLSLVSDLLGVGSFILAVVAYSGSLVASLLNPLPPLAKGALALGLTAAIGLFFSLITQYARRRRPEKHNPNLKILEANPQYKIWPHKIERQMDRQVKALADNVKTVTYFFGPVQEGLEANLNLQSNGSVLGPIRSGGRDIYKIEFPEALTEGEVYHLQLEIEWKGPEEKVDTWLAEEFTNYGGYGKGTIKVEFKENPQSVMKALHPKETGAASVKKMEPVALSHDNTHTWNFDIQDGYRYAIDWDW